MCKKECVCFNDIGQLNIIQLRLKMKNGSRKYNVNRARPRHGHKYTKYNMCLGMMMVISNN